MASFRDAVFIRVVEKPLGLETLELGAIRLTTREAAALDLGMAATEVNLEVDGDEFIAQWKPTCRELRGEGFHEALALHGEIGGLLRLHPPCGGVIEVEFGAKPATGLRVRAVAAPRPEVPKVVASRRRRSLRNDRYRLRERSEYDWHGAVGFHRGSLDDMRGAIKGGGWDSEALFRLRARGEQLAAASSFDELLAVDVSSIDHMEHQEATALKVLRKMRGRAILADEVGLGKTIEAGLILKELVLRGLARRILVLTPASLREQWRDELHEKFGERFEIAAKPVEIRGNRLVMSINLARSNRDLLSREPWDLVIVDEAHKNAGGIETRRLLASLDTRYMLFLTATPVQNKITELYSLVELLRPGTFASVRDFRRRFVNPKNEHEPVDAAGLRALIADVMVRTTREQVQLDSVQRYPVDVPIELSEPERRVYEMCTRGLRSIMTEPGDAMRRRSLAHRLTASPRSLASTARKIAASHSDARVRDFLIELSDLAVNFGITSRQRALLDLIADWTSDKENKGKVIVFTQHSDTLDDLARILEEHGSEVATYHGGMNAKARLRSLDHFRGSAAVLLSTEAGAEGLNLQSANCVVNYDLPWNPMRIEQRIGRVHRLGQQRDVHVANFFARGTIDEDVYRLLHDKLRMFELLFGQITTILGELGETNGQGTFEGQLLDAFLSKTDQQMSAKLDSLGKRVDEAYATARKALDEQGSLNAWLVDRSHRDTITGPAEELRPPREERERKRQLDVATFARDYLAMVGATIETDDGGFIEARLPDHVREAFGDRESIFLAFNRPAIESHGHAELCAVGTEVFEEMLLSLRELGDLHGRMPALPQIPAKSKLAHDLNLTFVERRVDGPAEWTGHALWRTQVSGVDMGESIELLPLGPAIEDEPSSGYVPLLDGETAPDSIMLDPDVVMAAMERSRDELEARVVAAQGEIDDYAAADRDRILQGAYAQIPDLEHDSERGAGKEKAAADLQRVRRLVAHYENLTPPKAELRADLLALEIVGVPRFAITETWRDASGRTVELPGVWDPAAKPKASFADVDGRPIMHLAICRESHATDKSRSRRCPSCDELSCDLCKKAGRLTECLACGVAQCASCCPRNRNICVTCTAAERAPELDLDGARGWNLGFGARVIVGEGVSTFVSGDGVEHTYFVEGNGREALAAVARERGVREDLGLAADARYVALDLPSEALALDDETTSTSEIVPLGGAAIDVDALSQLDAATASAIAREGRLAPLLEQLRTSAPPDLAPKLMLRPCRLVRYLDPREDGLWCVEQEIVPGAEPVVDESRLDLAPSAGRSEVLLASAFGYQVRAERLHRSVILAVEHDDGDGASYFVPSHDGATEELERSAVAYAHAVGLPNACVLGTDGMAAMPADFAAPTHPILVSRSVAPHWKVEPRRGLRPLDEEVLRDAGAPEVEACSDPLPFVAYEGVLQQVLAALEPVEERTLVRCAEVAETWRDVTTASSVRLVAPGASAFPVLHDTGAPSGDFRIDSNRHLHIPETGWFCASCDHYYCEACDVVARLAPCATCSQDACAACRAQPTAELVSAECSICHARNCGACHRDIHPAACPLCGELVCAGCCEEHVCVACASLVELDSERVRGLPPELHADGLAVWGDERGGRTRVAIVGAHRRELVVVEDGAVVSWRSFVPRSPTEFRAVFAIARMLGLPADLAVSTRHEDPEPAPASEDLEVARGSEADVRWEIVRSSGATAARSRVGAPLPGVDDDPLAVVADLSGGAQLRVPAAAPVEVHAVFPVLSPRLMRDPVDELRIIVRHTERQHLLSSAGLIERVRTCDGDAENLVPWTDGDGARSEQIATPHPKPDATMHVEVDDLAVLASRFGNDLFVTVRGPETDATFATGAPGWLERVQLADMVRVGRSSIVVVDWLDPLRARYLDVKEADLVSSTITPMFAEATSQQNADEHDAAVRSWVDRSAITWNVESNGDVEMPTRLADSIKRRMGASPGAQRSGAIGVHVHQVWRSGSGEATLVYDLIPGSSSFRAHDTGTAADAVHLDREGHFVAASLLCPYCDTRVCGRCTGPVAPCALCGVALCGACSVEAHGLAMCPACVTLEPPGRIRRVFRRASPERAALSGDDRVHSVTVLAVDGSVAVEWQSDRDDSATSVVPLAVTPQLRNFLNERAGRELV